MPVLRSNQRPAQESQSVNVRFTGMSVQSKSNTSNRATKAGKELSAALSYDEFLASKRIFSKPCGFEIDRSQINPMMLDPKHAFQADIVQWACRRGKAAVFAATGLGKGPIQLEWCRFVCLHTGGDCLIVAPLAVAMQFVREAAKFSTTITLCREQSDVRPGINVTNYDRLDLFDLKHFAGVSLDESSCIKDWQSKTSQGLIAALESTPFKLCSSATPSPNEHSELGTHAELLDVMSRTQMLAMFFEHDGGQTSKWSLKGHGKKAFFNFLSQFCVCVSKPSDIGPYDDAAYVLPPLNLIEHIVAVDHSINTDGMLFRCPDMSATGLHKEMRLTAGDRAASAAQLVSEKPDEPWLIWCNTDYEADAVKGKIPQAINIKGSHSPDKKEAAIMHFLDSPSDWLLSKGAIFGYGLNLQKCANMIIFVDYSFEKMFQIIRRCWRFGQTREVNAHVIVAETEGAIMSALREKEAAYEELQREMSEAMRHEQLTARYQSANYEHLMPIQIPTWLTTQEAEW